MPNSLPDLSHTESAVLLEKTPCIKQQVIAVDAARRTQLLRHLIAQNDWHQVLVFVATKHAAEIVADKLRRTGLRAEPWHNQLSSGKRTQVLLDFRAGRLRVMVATELPARGIAMVQVPVVVNYDLPRSALDYSCRSAWVASSGLLLNLVSAATEAHLSLIEKRQHLSLPREHVAGFEPLAGACADVSAVAPLTGGIKGKRPSKKDKLRAAGPSGNE